MFGPIHVTPIIANYTFKYPETSVNAIFKDEIVDFLEDNIDVAIRIGHLKDSSLMAKKVASLRWIVCGSPAYLEKNGTPETPNDLNTHKLVNLTVHDHRYNWEFKNAEKIRPKNDLIVNSILASKAAALADWGLIQAGSSSKRHKIYSIICYIAQNGWPIFVKLTKGWLYKYIGKPNELADTIRAFRDTL